jgi:hypothetical protein
MFVASPTAQDRALAICSSPTSLELEEDIMYV